MAAHDAGKSDLYGGIILCLATAAALAVANAPLGRGQGGRERTRGSQGPQATRGVCMSEPEPIAGR